MNSLEFILNLHSAVKFDEIWILNMPYFFLHPFWQNLAGKTPSQKDTIISKLKQLHLQSQMNYIFEKSGVKPKFLRGYS